MSEETGFASVAGGSTFRFTVCVPPHGIRRRLVHDTSINQQTARTVLRRVGRSVETDDDGERRSSTFPIDLSPASEVSRPSRRDRCVGAEPACREGGCTTDEPPIRSDRRKRSSGAERAKTIAFRSPPRKKKNPPCKQGVNNTTRRCRCIRAMTNNLGRHLIVFLAERTNIGQP